MAELAVLKDAVSGVTRGTAHDAANRVADRVEAGSESFRLNAAEMVESVAHQIRDLGARFERPDEAHRVARRLERTSDYIRYRPATRVAGDALRSVRDSRAVWAAGGVLAGLIAYRLINHRQH